MYADVLPLHDTALRQEFEYRKDGISKRVQKPQNKSESFQAFY